MYMYIKLYTYIRVFRISTPTITGKRVLGPTGT